MKRKDTSFELYIHIPFCVRKCAYCDFLSAPGSEEAKASYTEALLREIEAVKTEKEKYLPFLWEEERRLRFLLL